MSRIGLVLEGGSFRGIFTAGVLDYLMEQKVSFPYVVGVSAGSGNAVNFISGQKGRTQKVIMHENADPYYGLGQFRKSKKLLDLDKMLYDYSYDQIPFDFKTYFSSDTVSEFVVANCRTGQAEYLKANGSQEHLLEICKASCSVPMICNPVPIGDQEYVDGSTIDSVPFARALQNCDKVVVILTRKEGEQPTDYAKMRTLLNICYHYHYPKLVDAMVKRKEVYERQMKELSWYEKTGKAFVIRPQIESIGHFESDSAKIGSFYQHGYEIMQENLGALLEFMKDAD